MKMQRAFNVNGWVRNLNDGRVEAFLRRQSKKRNIDKMIELCKIGPSGAKK